MTELALRPRSATEILDLAVRLLRRHVGALLTIALVGVVPVLIVQLFFVSMLRGDPTRVLTMFTSYGLLSFLVLLAVRSFMLAALLVGADDALRTGTVDVGSALRRSVPRVGVAIGVSLLASLAIGVGFALLFVPGVYIALRLATALPAAVVEGDGVFEALQRAWKRSEGHLMHSLTTLLLLVLIFAVFSIAVGLVVGIGTAFGGGAARVGWSGVVVAQAIGAILTAAVYPLLTNTLLVLAYDLRVRREGYDVEAMADALGTAR